MEYANCQVCHAPYNTRGKKPIQLTCNHTLCLECQLSLAKPECPSCKKVFAPGVDIKTNLFVFQLVAERELIEYLKPSVKPTIIPTEVSQKYEEIKGSEEVKRPNIINKAERYHPEMMMMAEYQIPLDKFRCRFHESENLEWFISDETQSCIICKSSTIPKFGYWRCKYLDYFVCTTCKPPIFNSCPGHTNIPLQWINREENYPTPTTCKICKKVTTANECVYCPKGCIVCNSCHSTHFTTFGYNMPGYLYLAGVGLPPPRLVKINECYEYCTDACCIGCCFSIPYIGWIYCGIVMKYNKCLWCRTSNGWERLDCKCSCLMRSAPGCRYDHTSICLRCLRNNCSFHPDTPVNKKSITFTCFRCHSTVPIQGGGWVCPHGDMVLCRKCMFYPKSLCPQHPRKLMILNSNSDIIEKCSICLTHNGTWKCKECPFFVCNKCTKSPLFCPNHTTRDLVYTSSKKRIICSMCYIERSGLGSYSCPESDYFICDKCYNQVINYLYIYIYILYIYIFAIYFLGLSCMFQKMSFAQSV